MREKLNWFHILILVHMLELDTTVFSISRVLAENIGTNGLLALLPLSAVATINLLLYAWLYRAGRGQSAFQLLQSVVPRKWLLVPFYLALAGFWVYLASLIGKNFILISQLFSLYSSNSMLIFLLYCGLMYALLVKGMYAMVKASTIFFLIFVWINGFVPYLMQNWSYHRLTLFLFQGSDHGQTLHGWAESYMVFVGYELCLFLFPYTNKKSKLFKGVFLGQALITFIYMMAAIVGFGFFSFDEVKELQFPLINTLEYLELPFLNRPENLVFTLFLFPTLVSSVFFGFAALTTLQQVFPRAKGKTLEASVVFAAFLFGFASETLIHSDMLLRKAYFIEIGIAFGLPILLIPVAYLARRKEASEGA